MNMVIRADVFYCQFPLCGIHTCQHSPQAQLGLNCTGWIGICRIDPAVSSELTHAGPGATLRNVRGFDRLSWVQESGPGVSQDAGAVVACQLPSRLLDQKRMQSHALSQIPRRQAKGVEPNVATRGVLPQVLKVMGRVVRPINGNGT